MTITRTSIFTGVTRTMLIPELTQEMLNKWKTGTPAQDAFVGIDAGLREFIMTGTSPEEWDSMFGGWEE